MGHHGDGTASKRWKRRSRLVARELALAEGKRDDIFSPALRDVYTETSTSTHNILAESR